MRTVIVKPAAAATLALGLSACAAQPPILTASEPSFVDKVDVRLAETVKSQNFAEALRSKTRREATRYGRSGAPKELRISVKEVHYKNPALSLLIGDGNHVLARVAVVDAATGRSHGEFDTGATDSRAINGVVGAVIAMAQKEEVVDQRLAENLASNVLERVYGAEAAAEARKRPPVETADGPAPASAPKPDGKPAPKKPGAKPDGVPTAAVAQGERSAMASPAAPTTAAR